MNKLNFAVTCPDCGRPLTEEETVLEISYPTFRKPWLFIYTESDHQLTYHGLQLTSIACLETLEWLDRYEDWDGSDDELDGQLDDILETDPAAYPGPRAITTVPDYPACVTCGEPVERAIEGKLICSNCWRRQEMTEEELAQEAEIRNYTPEPPPTCPECDAVLSFEAGHPDTWEEPGQPSVLWCPECGYEEPCDIPPDADFGTGELSPGAELRKAALDHRGCP